jgi:hypothetical protein
MTPSPGNRGHATPPVPGNPCVRIREIEVLSDNWYTLREASFDYQEHPDGMLLETPADLLDAEAPRRRSGAEEETHRHAGVAGEGEHIEVVELPFGGLRRWWRAARSLMARP